MAQFAMIRQLDVTTGFAFCRFLDFLVWFGGFGAGFGLESEWVIWFGLVWLMSEQAGTRASVREKKQRLDREQ